MVKDINKEPYDEPTLVKLEIFEQYLREWLPVFIEDQYTSRVKICDFCAGSGQDAEGVPGSPFLILNKIDEYRTKILDEKKNIVIDVLLNETKLDKFNELDAAVKNRFDQDAWNSKVTVSCHCEKFQELFREQYEQLKQQPNLLFIDQYGIKEVTDEFFQMLVKLKKTDFLFFISSSAMKRFASTPGFKEHFPDLDVDKITNTEFQNSHRFMLDYYASKIPASNSTKLYPFTLKKGPNVYGLIFGSGHPLGVEKFLDLVWSKNAINGEANFDIDEDKKKKQRSLFDSLSDYEPQKTKCAIFEANLEDYILGHDTIDNRSIYYFTLNQGHPKSHAKECVRRMKKEKKIDYKGQIGFSYSSCVKNDPKTITVLKKNPHG